MNCKYKFPLYTFSRTETGTVNVRHMWTLCLGSAGKWMGGIDATTDKGRMYCKLCQVTAWKAKINVQVSDIFVHIHSTVLPWIAAWLSAKKCLSWSTDVWAMLWPVDKIIVVCFVMFCFVLLMWDDVMTLAWIEPLNNPHRPSFLVSFCPSLTLLPGYSKPSEDTDSVCGIASRVFLSSSPAVTGRKSRISWDLSCASCPFF